MKLTLQNIALILGAAQGFLLAALIFQRHRKLMANRFLGLLMFVSSLLLVQMLFTDLGYNQKFPHLFLALLGLPFLVSPLHYLYAKSLINFSKRMNRLDWLHFLPFAIRRVQRH